MTIKEQYIDDLNFEVDLRNGTFKDTVAGVVPTSVNTKGYWKNTPCGRTFVYNKTENQKYGDIADFDYNEAQTITFKFATVVTTSDNFLAKTEGVAGNYKGWAVYLGGGYVVFRIYQNGLATGFRVRSQAPAQRWYDGLPHIATITYDGSGLASGVKCVVDTTTGETTQSDAGFTASTLTTQPLSIGTGITYSAEYKGEMFYVAKWDRVLTPAEVTQLHSEMLEEEIYNRKNVKNITLPAGDSYPTYLTRKGIGWHVTPSPNVITNTYIDNTEWRRLTGTWEVRDGNVYPEKKLTCSSSGIIYRDSQQAYGKWRFTLNTDSAYYFMSDSLDIASTNGYSVTLTGAQFLFYRNTVAGGQDLLFYSASGLPSTGEKTLEIERSALGAWSFYLVDVNNVRTLITPATAGTNPVTDTTTTKSKYSLLNANSNNSILDFQNKALGL